LEESLSEERHERIQNENNKNQFNPKCHPKSREEQGISSKKSRENKIPIKREVFMCIVR